MNKDIIYTVGSTVKAVLLSILTIIVLLAMFFMAVLQQSYRMCPPTDEELQDDPALIIYRGE